MSQCFGSADCQRITLAVVWSPCPPRYASAGGKLEILCRCRYQSPQRAPASSAGGLKLFNKFSHGASKHLYCCKRAGRSLTRRSRRCGELAFQKREVQRSSLPVTSESSLTPQCPGCQTLVESMQVRQHGSTAAPSPVIGAVVDH